MFVLQMPSGVSCTKGVIAIIASICDLVIFKNSWPDLISLLDVCTSLWCKRQKCITIDLLMFCYFDGPICWKKGTRSEHSIKLVNNTLHTG